MKPRLLSLIMCVILIFSSAAAVHVCAEEADIPLYVPAEEDGGLAATGADNKTAAADESIPVPQIRVDTAAGNGTSLQKTDGYVDAQISITDTDGSVLSDSVQFKVRGNTTALTGIQKKAYTFKFSKKKDVLGMGKGKKWALLANAFDPTMLRNYTAFGIACELGLEFTSNQKFVELWVDGSYRGCYGLYEPVQEGKDRVNIDIESNNGKKDFLIEYEAKRVEDDVTYFTVGDLRFIASEPEEPDEAQLAYITDTMTDIVSVIKSGDEQSIREKLDVDSFAKFYLLNEFVKNYDFDMSSVFFYYKDGKLFAGPAWDYDLSAGNENPKYEYYYRYRDSIYPTGLLAYNKNIYKYLGSQPWFAEEVEKLYNAHYGFFTSIGADGGFLDKALEEYGPVFEKNYAPGVWKVTRAWINIQKPPLATYRENYDFLKNWYQERNKWLSNYFGVPFCILGDSDDDGIVTIIDATLISRCVVGIEVPKLNEAAADVDGDENISAADATFVQRFTVSVNTPYKIGGKKRYPH